MSHLVLICALAASGDPELERIRSHLELVETLLRAQPAPTRETQLARERNLDALNAYWRGGQFPRNTRPSFQ